MSAGLSHVKMRCSVWGSALFFLIKKMQDIVKKLVFFIECRIIDKKNVVLWVFLMKLLS